MVLFGVPWLDKKELGLSIILLIRGGHILDAVVIACAARRSVFDQYLCSGVNGIKGFKSLVGFW